VGNGTGHLSVAMQDCRGCVTVAQAPGEYEANNLLVRNVWIKISGSWELVAGDLWQNYGDYSPWCAWWSLEWATNYR